MIIYYMTRYPDILPECFATNVISISSIPLSIFQTNGEMRPSKSKSDLKTVLQVTTFQRNQSKSEVIIVDGCEKFWDITWPKNGTALTVFRL